MTTCYTESLHYCYCKGSLKLVWRWLVVHYNKSLSGLSRFRSFWNAFQASKFLKVFLSTYNTFNLTLSTNHLLNWIHSPTLTLLSHVSHWMYKPFFKINTLNKYRNEPMNEKWAKNNVREVCDSFVPECYPFIYKRIAFALFVFQKIHSIK